MMQSQSIIVIHPGSSNLRIGKASDLNPIVLLHAIARRRRAGEMYEDFFLPASKSMTEKITKEMEETRLQVSHTLQSCLQSTGSRRYATPPQQVAAFNKRVVAEVMTDADNKYPMTDWDQDVLFEDDIINLDPGRPYNVHFPWRRGDLNIHSGVGGSLTSVLSDLQAIWTHAISNKLNVNLRTLKHYKAVLIIPDSFNRGNIRELTALLFRIGFGCCFLVQDHVAATFGAGLACACVVDVGDQKTSISCVEDGICHPFTRVRLGFGGADVTECFYWLLQKCAFPFKDCDPRNRIHACLLQSLKESFCHVNLDICGSEEKTFTVREPNKPVRKFTIQVGDEAMVAPLGLFCPELLAATAERGVTTQHRNMGHSEDPFDDTYLRETTRRREREETAGTDETMEAGDEDIVVDSIEVSTNKDFVLPPETLLGLDQAILQSIDRCPNDDMKRKMYGCILIVGCGMKFHGIDKWLHNRISLHTPFMHRPEKLDVIMNPKDMDPGNAAWKGACIMSCLDSAKELWIFHAEFEKWGAKVLRERAPFVC